MARRRSGLLAPMGQRQVDDLEVTFAASLGFEALESQGTYFPEPDSAPTLPIRRLGTSRTPPLSGNPVSPMSPIDMPVALPTPARPFSAWSRRYVLLLAGCDVLAGGLATAIPAQFSNTLSPRIALVAVLALLGAIVWPISVGLARGYVRSRVGVGSEELRAVLRAAIGVVVVGAFPAGLLGQQALLKLVVVGVPTAVVLSVTVRFVARRILHSRQRDGLNMRHILVVGSAAAAQELRERLEKDTSCGMKVVGACLPYQCLDTATDLGMPVLGDLSEVADIVKHNNCDAVAVTSDDSTRYNYLRKLAWSLEGSGVEMLVDPGLVEVAGPRMHIRPIMGAPLLHIEEPHFSGWRRVIKRGSDVAITTIGLIAISPVLVLIALLIKLQDGGPVLFRQKRVGRGGHEFWMYKFRSMVMDAEARKAELMAHNEGKGGLFKLAHDPRITPLGRFLRDFSLDELPQLLNVLNGTMSLVGPRPHLAQELAQMPFEASRRTLVTPGLTGLWQVSGRSDLEGDDAVRLDLRYVENWSFTLDLLILWKTTAAVLAKRGAH